MNLHVFKNPPPPALGIALEEFETQFRYPLGTEGSFSISHGRDYIAFFSAIGEPTLLVAEHHGCVLGTLSAAIRTVRFPDASERATAYLGDLKVAPTARGGVVLGRMFQAMHELLIGPSGGRAYGVVMDGTGRIPPNYTGRLGVPVFAPIGGVVILKVSTHAMEATVGDPLCELTAGESAQVHASLAPRGFIPIDGNPLLRSSIGSIELATCDGRACGRLEDTRLAKRLLVSPNDEIRAAHLSRFAFATVSDGAQLLLGAAARCAAMDIPTLFAAVPAAVAPSLAAALSSPALQEIRATVFGCGFGDEAADWWVDTAEI